MFLFYRVAFILLPDAYFANKALQCEFQAIVRFLLSPSWWSFSLRDGVDVANLFNSPERPSPAGIPETHTRASAVSLPSHIYRSPLSLVLLVPGPFAAGLQALIQTRGQKFVPAAKLLHLTQLRPRPCPHLPGLGCLWAAETTVSGAEAVGYGGGKGIGKTIFQTPQVFRSRKTETRGFRNVLWKMSMVSLEEWVNLGQKGRA